MSTTPKAIAKLKHDFEERYIWVWGDDPNAPACISRTPPDSEEGCRPLQALIAHIQPEEWDEV